MVEQVDPDDKKEDKASNEVVDDVKKVAMEGVDKEKKQVAMKGSNQSNQIELALTHFSLKHAWFRARLIRSIEMLGDKL